MRYKMIISYDGSSYHGFQRQKELITVQSHLETVLTKIFKTPIVIHGAGRTDAFVHAINQVVHFDNEQLIPLKNLKKVINKNVYPYIYVKNIEIVDQTFHSRISAVKKEYRYYVNTNEYDPLKANYQLFFHSRLDVDKMKIAMTYLIGTHDFRGLSKSEITKKTVRTIYEFTLSQTDGILEFRVVGDGFLRNMVRIMIAVILKIGEGKFEPSFILKVLETKDRKLVPFVTKPCGLYLYEIRY